MIDSPTRESILGWVEFRAYKEKDDCQQDSYATPFFIQASAVPGQPIGQARSNNRPLGRLQASHTIAREPYLFS